MNTGHPLSLLLFITLAVVVLVLAFLLARHLRKPGNRHPMAGERERTGEEIHREGGGG